MNRLRNKQRPLNLLVTFLVSALLFMTFVDLHIHASDVSASINKVSAIHISSVADQFADQKNSDEVHISPSGVLKKSSYDNLMVLAVLFLLTTLVALSFRLSCVGRFHDIPSRLIQLAFHGTPPLRAPPVSNS